MWLGDRTPVDDVYMNKVFNSKVTVTTSYLADQEEPIAVIKTTKNGNEITVDASESFDNMDVVKYYYSMGGNNFVSSNESTYVFQINCDIQYGKATDLVTYLDSTELQKVYVKVEDDSGNISEVVSKVVEELFYDETNDNNLRYTGSSPNNYVLFNDELWQIIGVMNNVDNGAGEVSSRIKLI